MKSLKSSPESYMNQDSQKIIETSTKYQTHQYIVWFIWHNFYQITSRLDFPSNSFSQVLINVHEYNTPTRSLRLFIYSLPLNFTISPIHTRYSKLQYSRIYLPLFPSHVIHPPSFSGNVDSSQSGKRGSLSSSISIIYFSGPTLLSNESFSSLVAALQG